MLCDDLKHLVKIHTPNTYSHCIHNYLFFFQKCRFFYLGCYFYDPSLSFESLFSLIKQLHTSTCLVRGTLTGSDMREGVTNPSRVFIMAPPTCTRCVLFNVFHDCAREVVGGVQEWKNARCGQRCQGEWKEKRYYHWFIFILTEICKWSRQFCEHDRVRIYSTHNT